MKTIPFRRLSQRALKDEDAQRLLKILPFAFRSLREAALAEISDPKGAIQKATAMRMAALEELPLWLKTFEQRAKENGTKVLWAKDAKQARGLALGILRSQGAREVLKSKSMLTEEIGLRESLEQEGYETLETDLGEFICQKLGLPPFHIVGPAINVPVERVAELFLGMGLIKEPTTDPIALGLAARAFFREKFSQIKVGITGVNLAIAQTGSIMNVENEGNIRFLKSIPEVQVSFMGIEKVVPTLEDALSLLRLLPASCTGQRMSAYVTVDKGPRRPGEADGPKELYVVIVDNGRSKIYQNPKTRPALACIRCGACLNVCPVYAQVGGYPYGFAYSGPMGLVWTPMLMGLRSSKELLEACSLCGACHEVCTVGIDHPEIILELRRMRSAQGPFSLEKALYEIFGFGLSGGFRQSLGLKAIRPFYNRIAGRFRLPPLARRSFRETLKADLHGKETR
jgi:L-lactate dehydrogenase complex protein LldF